MSTQKTGAAGDRAIRESVWRNWHQIALSRLLCIELQASYGSQTEKNVIIQFTKISLAHNTWNSIDIFFFNKCPQPLKLLLLQFYRWEVSLGDVSTRAVGKYSHVLTRQQVKLFKHNPLVWYPAISQLVPLASPLYCICMDWVALLLGHRKEYYFCSVWWQHWVALLIMHLYVLFDECMVRIFGHRTILCF